LNTVEYSWLFPFELVGTFFYTMVASALIGSAFGILGTLMLRKMRFLSNTPIFEIMVVFMSAYSAYTIGKYLF